MYFFHITYYFATSTRMIPDSPFPYVKMLAGGGGTGKNPELICSVFAGLPLESAVHQRLKMLALKSCQLLHKAWPNCHFHHKNTSHPNNHVNPLFSIKPDYKSDSWLLI